MVLRTFNFWGFCSLNWKTIVFNDMFSKKSLKSMVLSTFNFWGFCGPYRDFLYYYENLSLSMSIIRSLRNQIFNKNDFRTFRKCLDVFTSHIVRTFDVSKVVKLNDC